MRVIDPSFIILDQLDRQSLPVRIEYSGRICYKSEDRIDKDSAVPFVRKMAEYGHNSVLEMGVVTYRVTGPSIEQVNDFFHCIPKYVQVDLENGTTLLLTGSVRAYREMFLHHPDNAIIRAVTHQLNTRHPYFFENLPSAQSVECHQIISATKLSLDEVERLDPKRFTRHRYLAVKFIVNRAVTHELVRHRPCAFLQESQRYCRYSTDKFGNEVTFIRPLFFEQNSPEFDQWRKAMEETEKIYLNLLETSTPQAARTVLPNSCKTEIIVYTNLEEWRHILSLRTPKNADPSMREVMIPLQEELQKMYPEVFITG